MYLIEYCILKLLHLYISASIQKETAEHLGFVCHCIQTMPHNLRRAFVTEHHIDISVFPHYWFLLFSTVSIGPFV